MNTPKNLIKLCIDDIDQFYKYSFRMPPDRAIPLVIAVFNRLEALSVYLPPSEFQVFQDYLRKTMEYMERQDYVLMRDCLHYELRAWLQNL